MLRPAVTLPDFGVGNVAGLQGEGLVRGGRDHVFHQLRVRRVEGLRIDLDGGDGAIAFGDDLDCAAAARGFDGLGGQLRLDFFPSACCMRAACFMSFLPMLRA